MTVINLDYVGRAIAESRQESLRKSQKQRIAERIRFHFWRPTR